MDDIIPTTKPKKSLPELLFPKKPWYKNLLLYDWRDYVIFMLVVLMVLGHKYDTAPYIDIAKNPCDYCVIARTIPFNHSMEEGDKWSTPLTGTLTLPNVSAERAFSIN